MKHLGKETYIEVDGKRYRLARFDRGVWREFMEWANTQLPDLIDAARQLMHGLPPEQQDKLVNSVLDRAAKARSIQSPEVQELLNSPEGISFVLSKLLQKHQPELLDDEAWEIFEAALAEHGSDYLQEKIKQASGEVPPKDCESKKKK